MFHAFFDRPLELPLAARTRIHVGLHIVSTEAALVKKILNAKACNALLIHPHAGNRGCPGRPQAKS